MEPQNAQNARNTREIQNSVKLGTQWLASLQHHDGSWRSEYGGPMFLLPMYILACSVAGRPIDEDRQKEMVRYLRSVLNDDGSVGLHELDQGTMFTTVLVYVALRQLGIDSTDPDIQRIHRWIHQNGTALGAAPWGKLMLAVLNLYPYEGLHPILPELWLLPRNAPVHPGNLWCHSRQVYLSMAWLYGNKAHTEADGLTRKLREELYDRPYRSIDFGAEKHNIATADNRYPPSKLLRVANTVMNGAERFMLSSLRTRALDEIYEHIKYEDQTTAYLDIGPVNRVLNALVHHFKNPGGTEENRSFEALEDYLCQTERGLKLNGYNSTAFWDTAFAVQALLASNTNGQHIETLEQAFKFIDENQVLKELPDADRHFRHQVAGGWPFSDAKQGWPVSDCTAEGFKTSIELGKVTSSSISDDRLKKAVELMLSLQNPDGGWASYEKKRGGDWLELLNPSHVFSDIMVEHSYVECTSACLGALAEAQRRFGSNRRIDEALSRGLRFLKDQQRPDGSWYGSWAVCFTYGTWFGVTGLLETGLDKDSSRITRACNFLEKHQNPDGGWGEHFSTCIENRWIPAESTVVQTSWALMTLVRAGRGQEKSAIKASEFLVSKQLDNGDWPKEPLVGVFNKTTLIDYDNYRRYFPIWALAEHHRSLAE